MNKEINNIEETKSIMVICPSFYEYEHKIKDSLESAGYTVHPVFYKETEMVPFSFLDKLFFRIFNKFFKKFKWYTFLQHKYYYKKSKVFFDGLLSDVKNKEFDFLLVIKGFGLYDYHIDNIKAKHKVIYQWDIISNFPLVPSYVYKCFDKVFTFDNSDAKKNLGVFLPLFYVSSGVRKKETVYDLFFVGLYTKHRYDVMKKVVAKAKFLNVSYFIKLLRPNPLRLDKKHSYLITHSPLSRSEYENVFDSSRLILEMPHKGQAGTTQRLLEGLEQDKIVCTSGINETVESNSVISLDDFLAFSKKDYEKLMASKFDNSHIIAKFELSRWLDTVLSH